MKYFVIIWIQVTWSAGYSSGGVRYTLNSVKNRRERNWETVPVSGDEEQEEEVSIHLLQFNLVIKRESVHGVDGVDGFIVTHQINYSSSIQVAFK